MNKNNTLLFPRLIFFVILLSFISFKLQWKINQFDKDIKIKTKEISDTDVEIKILKTEIYHLTSITRIKDIASKYLHSYKNISSDDFVKIIDIPVNPRLNNDI